MQIVGPHQHPATIAIAADIPNERFVPELTGQYGLPIATVAFEHDPDPISLGASKFGYLCIGGLYLIANCFVPAISCHLPQVFHLAIDWDLNIQAMELHSKSR